MTDPPGEPPDAKKPAPVLVNAVESLLKNGSSTALENKQGFDANGEWHNDNPSLFDHLSYWARNNPATAGLVFATTGVFAIWPYVGGGIFTYNYLRPFVMGRNLYTLEYPFGVPKAITVRHLSIQRLQKSIAVVNNLPDYQQVRHLNHWIKDYFTEDLKTNPWAVETINDYSFVIWSREEGDNPIPFKGCTLQALGTDLTRVARVRVDQMITFISGRLQKTLDENSLEELMALAAQRDAVLDACFKIFTSEPELFQKICLARLRFEAKVQDNTQELAEISKVVDYLSDLVKSPLRTERLTVEQAGIIVGHLLEGRRIPIFLHKKFGFAPQLFKTKIKRFLEDHTDPFAAPADDKKKISEDSDPPPNAKESFLAREFVHLRSPDTDKAARPAMKNDSAIRKVVLQKVKEASAAALKGSEKSASSS